MRVLGENENNDLYVGPNNQLVVNADLAALIQRCKSVMERQFAEMIYNADAGIPTDRVIWSGNPDLQQFELFAREAIGSVDGVTEIQNFEVEIIGDVCNYQAVIKSIYGTDNLNGSL